MPPSLKLGAMLTQPVCCETWLVRRCKVYGNSQVIPTIQRTDFDG